MDNLDGTTEVLEQGVEQDTQVTEEQDTTNIEDIKVTGNETQEEEKPFSVDDLEFEDNYKVGDYDLSKYKDIISAENMQALEGYAKEYSEKGFTQEQIEFLIDKELENKKPNREEVQKELNKYLSVEEKRNYKTVGKQLKTALESDGLGAYYEEAMTNPIVFKIINSVLKTRGANIGANIGQETRENKSLTGYQAVEEFNKYLRENMGNADIKGKQKELLGKLSEKEKKYFKEMMGL